ncbi:hypothetical protein HDE_08278 [Halotydeus destructor]|nr:hypothetical protein HDE_08278 [Halotydeus destructor]
MSEKDMKAVNRIWDHIKTNGSTEHGVHDNDLINMPNWFNRQRFIESQEHLKSHKTSSGPIVVHQAAHLQFVHYLVAILKLWYTLHDWYEDDLFDPTTDGHKSIRRVVTMHQHVAKAMNMWQSNRSDAHVPHRWLSQLDMTMTQWAFIGLILQFPEKCGLHNGTQQTFAAIIYVWRVISYLIGVKDEYSMCLDSVDDTIALSRLVYRDIYHPVLSAEVASAPQGHQMALDILKSLRCVFGKVNGNIFFKYWYACLEIDKKVPLEGSWDILSYYLLHFQMDFVYYYAPPIYRWYGDRKRALVLKSFADRGKIAENMAEEDKVDKFLFQS